MLQQDAKCLYEEATEEMGEKPGAEKHTMGMSLLEKTKGRSFVSRHAAKEIRLAIRRGS